MLEKERELHIKFDVILNPGDLRGKLLRSAELLKLRVLIAKSDDDSVLLVLRDAHLLVDGGRIERREAKRDGPNAKRLSSEDDVLCSSTHIVHTVVFSTGLGEGDEDDGGGVVEDGDDAHLLLSLLDVGHLGGGDHVGLVSKLVDELLVESGVEVELLAVKTGGGGTAALKDGLEVLLGNGLGEELAGASALGDELDGIHNREWVYN